MFCHPYTITSYPQLKSNTDSSYISIISSSRWILVRILEDFKDLRTTSLEVTAQTIQVAISRMFLLHVRGNLTRLCFQVP